MRDFFIPIALQLWNFWPPFVGAGIAIETLDLSRGYVRVCLKRRPWTANIIGLQFGGSIYAMVDPFYMVLLGVKLGREFFVIDKSAQVRFLKPGTSRLTAEFNVTSQDLDEIRSRLSVGQKMDWCRQVQVKDEQGTVVAEIDKVVYIKRKGQK